MGGNFYSEINLHITWHTKESSPLLVPKVETEVHHYAFWRMRLLSPTNRTPSYPLVFEHQGCFHICKCKLQKHICPKIGVFTFLAAEHMDFP